ncbi:hypothetical protein F5Y15DRAFT_412747 [Xylariaceae sp. FL0016]|nr:hypothetical protein F5Y15DRAFT_412747 [Xylariaceae sp. FL0016]
MAPTEWAALWGSGVEQPQLGPRDTSCEVSVSPKECCIVNHEGLCELYERANYRVSLVPNANRSDLISPDICQLGSCSDAARARYPEPDETRASIEAVETMGFLVGFPAAAIIVLIFMTIIGFGLPCTTDRKNLKRTKERTRENIERRRAAEEAARQNIRTSARETEKTARDTANIAKKSAETKPEAIDEKVEHDVPRERVSDKSDNGKGERVERDGPKDPGDDGAGGSAQDPNGKVRGESDETGDRTDLDRDKSRGNTDTSLSSAAESLDARDWAVGRTSVSKDRDPTEGPSMS